MTSFKVGDRVAQNRGWKGRHGAIGTVTRIFQDRVKIVFDDDQTYGGTDQGRWRESNLIDLYDPVPTGPEIYEEWFK